jgi:transposase
VLDVSGFRHLRINHSKLFADGKNHINGIENFWNQASATSVNLAVFPKRFSAILKGL